MNITHFDLGPLFYGLIMFIGIAVMWFKLTSGRWLSLAIDVGVFALVFSLHGGTMSTESLMLSTHHHGQKETSK